MFPSAAHPLPRSGQETGRDLGLYGVTQPGHQAQRPAAQGSKGRAKAGTCPTIKRGEQRLLTGPCDGERFLYHFPIAPCQRGSIVAAVVATTVIDSLVLGLDPSDG